ncbi:ATP-dependent RNA helicase DDX24 [Nelusetta ayraudi]|uniref:ATP-dependent RNA helicase DDX24 n=1 Tax=Nelusetta ayraudi TaxID=303726 RepID=UPI003F70B4BF
MKAEKKKPYKKRMFNMQPKRLKRSIHVKGSWKAIELDPSVFSEEGLEGLVCFEELTDYRLVEPEKAANPTKEVEKPNKKKGKKRKASEGEEVAEKEESERKEEAPEPAKKKKNKKSAKKLAQPDDTPVDVPQEDTCATEEAVDDEPAGKEISSDPDAESKPAKKRKKKKKQKEDGSTTEEQSNKEAPSEAQEAKPKKSVEVKVAKKPKKQIKSWTNAALSGLDDKDADVSAWKDLFVPPPVLKALSSLGFSSPTAIQALALPSAIRDRKDILGAAETGSGKTLAFGIPMIHSILEWKKSPAAPVVEDAKPCAQVESLYLPSSADLEESTLEEDEMDAEGDDTGDDEEEGSEKLGCVQVIDDAEFDFEQTAEQQRPSGSPLLGLVLTPTRELAVQVKHHIDAAAKFTDIKTMILVGGMAQQKQRRVLKKGPEIIIATPGRLWDMIKEKHPHLMNLRQVRCLVIDEADRMVERGHFAELESLLEMLNSTHFNPARQTFVFSATLTMAHSLPTRLLQRKNLDKRNRLEALMEKVGIKSKPKVIDLSRKEATAETLTETKIQCQKEEKDFYLYYFLLQYPGRTMVFANSIDCIKRLNSLLVILGRSPLPLHANMHQKQRLKNLERFAERDSCILLTTDVAARGLDIPNVQHVIHYQVPRTSETYVHRSGRTARATKEGLSLLLVGPDDMINFRKICKTLGKNEELPMFPIETKCLETIKERVDLAWQIEKIEFHNSKQKHHNSWLKQAADALEIDLDDDLLMGKGRDEDDEREQQAVVKGMKKQLKYLVSQPVFKHAARSRYPTQMGKLSLPHVPLAAMESALSRVTMQKTETEVQPQQKKQRKKKKQRK